MEFDLTVDENGLVPAIAQNAITGQVLMLGYVSQESLKLTFENSEVWFYSRSREALWRKGETSGNFLTVESINVDCDQDAIVLQVMPNGPTCHTGENSCFFTKLKEAPNFRRKTGGANILEELYQLILSRKNEGPPGSYTAELLSSGTGRIAQKVIEEAGESAIAATQGATEALVSEVSDLIYHTLVLLADSNIKPKDVWGELERRRKVR